jgi:hypothetical protein
MIIRNVVCPACNNPSQISEQGVVNHILKGGKVRCGTSTCKYEYWVFTPSDVLRLEAWGIAAEINYDFIAKVTT